MVLRIKTFFAYTVMDYYLNRFKSKVSSVAAQVSQALPGNPVFREYDLHEQVASAGPGLSWKIFSGTKNSTKQAVSIWLFEKRQVEKWPKHEKEAFPELLKRGVAQLTRLRHPRLLVVERPLEESRETFAFCTEPIFASLANIFTQKDISVHDFSFLDIEIRHGLFQLSEALVFLHNDAKMLHGNICPSSIVINERGAWKLAGFDFCVLSTPLSSGQVTFEIGEWDRRLMACMNPDLDYAAPELIQGVKCDTYADIFSFGVLTCTIFNDNVPFFECKGLLDDYKRNIDKLKQLNIDTKQQIPDVLKADLKVSLNITPELRPDAIQLTKIAYFDDSLLKIFNCLDSLMQMDNSHKMQFFKGLTLVLNKFPKRPLLQKMFPYLSAELTNVDLIPFILPNIFVISELATNKEFSSVIFPALIPVFAVQRPYQTVLLLLQNIQLFLQKTSDADVRKHVLPFIYNSISNENSKIQELCLSIVPTIGKLVDRDAMKTQLLPKLLRIILESSYLSVRVQTLLCLSKLMMNLEPWMVADQVLPAMPKITSKEPAILMAVLGIYKLAFETEKFRISTEQCAKSVLPFLVSSFVENSLNLQQFEQYSNLLHKMIEKVEKEQRQRLQQLSAAQEEQRNIDFNEILNTAASSSKSEPPKLNADLSALNDTIFNSTKNLKETSVTNATFPFDFGAVMPTVSANKVSLSLEEKKRLAAEQEQTLQSRNTPTYSRNSQTPSLIKPENTIKGSSMMDADLFSADFSTLADSISKKAATHNGKDLNLDDFANWTLDSRNEAKNLSPAFINFPQPPSTNLRNLVQRPVNNTSMANNNSLDNLLTNFNNTSNLTLNNSVQNKQQPHENFEATRADLNTQFGLTKTPIFPVSMAQQSVQPNRSSASNFQANFGAFGNLLKTSSDNKLKDPFDDLLR